MDGVAFQGMPRIALTPAEEALIPRPHSSASQVATAVPSAYTRTASSPSSPPRHPHHKNHHSSIAYHPYYAHPNAAGSASLAGLGAQLGSPSSASIPISTTPDPYSRSSSPGPRPVSPAFQSQHAAITPSSSSNNLTTEQEYPQNPQDGYYSQVPARSASPGPSRLAFSLTPRPARSPSPQLYNNLYDHHHYQPRTSYFHRISHDAQPRPGSPLQQEHQESWDSNQRMESLAPESDSDEDESQDGNDSDDEREEKQRPTAPRRSTSKSILKRLRETTSRLSFENGRRPSRTSQESEREREREREREQQLQQQLPRDSQDSTSTTRPGKEVLQDLSDEEKHLEPRKSRSGWRPSLSLIRQESSSSNANQYYLQNDPSRIGEVPSSRHSNDNNHNNPQPSNTKGKRRHRTKGGKDSKKRKRRNKRKRAERLAAQKQLQLQQQLYDQQMAEQARTLPTLTQVLEKKTRYPLSYEDFEAFLRTQRAVEYLNFWADVTAHEQLCRTFDVSERRHKREQQLEERAMARDKRRMALFAAMEADRMTPDPDLLAPGHAGMGAGVGIGANNQELHNSNLYVASRSSLQLPLNDHLSFPQESPRRYGLQDSSAPFPPLPPSLSSSNLAGTVPAGAYNRLLAGPGEAVGTGGRNSGEMSRPSLEEAAHISEQDAAVAAVAMRAQNSGLYMNNQSREDVRRGSFDMYRPLPGSASASNIARYQNHHGLHGGGMAGTLPTSYSTPTAFNLLMRGRGSMDVGVARSSSRNSRRAPASEDYFGNGIRRTSSQHFVHQSPQSLHPHAGQDDHHHADTQGQGRSSQDDHAAGEDSDHVIRRQASQYSIGFMEPDMVRRPSVRYGGFGPLQAPISIRRSGESAYTPSIFSNGQEGKALLALSFRTISLEDLQESALRIYRKYLIQLRTTSMAAEEEAAAQRSAAAKDSNGHYGGFPRGSLDKAIAPGWDGYAEEVIAQWNENWKGRSREARRSRRLSRNRSVTVRQVQGDGDGSALPSVAGEDSSSQADRQSSEIGGGLTVDIGKANARDKEEEGGSSEEDDRITPGGTRRKASSATSPTSPRMRKRTGTGLSAMLNPFLTRLMRTETTVVELPTLTINTTTIEEATAGDESDDEDEDDDDEEEDYDSDEEDDDDEDDDDDQSDLGEDSPPVSKKIIIDSSSTGVSKNQDEDLQPLPAQSQEEQVVVVERSMPTIAATSPQRASATGATEKAELQDADLEKAPTGQEETHVSGSANSPIMSSSSSLSSSWDRITKRDLEKQVTILPPPNTTSARNLPYRRHGGILGVRSTTGKATKAASSTALRVGTQLSALLSKSMRGRGGSSSSSLDTIQVTPITPRRSIGFRFHIPSIVMENQNEGDDDQEKAMEEGRSRTPPLNNNGEALAFPVSVASNSSGNGATSGGPMNEKLGLNSDPQQGSTPPASKPFLTPQTSAVTRPSSAASSPEQSTTAAADTPRLSVSSPAAVAASAAAAAFYLPLECRQRIHTQVQEEGRTEAPYLFGPAKGFVMDVVLEDHYYPLFLKYVEQQNLGLLNKTHANNVVKQRGMIWIGLVIWLIVLAIQLTLVLMGMGGWKSPWVWVVGAAGGWTGSICLATGIKGFSPILGILGKMCEDRRLFRFRNIMEPSIRIRHRRRAFWMLSYCIFWSTVIMVIFAALPQASVE